MAQFKSIIIVSIYINFVISVGFSKMDHNIVPVNFTLRNIYGKFNYSGLFQCGHFDNSI